MGKIRNAAQIRRHLSEWANYKQRLPKGVESVEFYQTLDQADVRSLQLSAVKRIWGVALLILKMILMILPLALVYLRRLKVSGDGRVTGLKC